MPRPRVTLATIQAHHIGGTLTTVRGLPIEELEVAPAAGTRPVDMNGTHCVGQMYAMQYELAEPRFALPIVLWHGGGLTGAQWESTPDGRPGWLWRLLDAGWNTWVCDGPERGRASWAMFPQIYRAPPLHRSLEEAWSLFRIGTPSGQDGRRRAFEGQRFPHRDFEHFARQLVPRWLDHESMAAAAYDALLATVGPCIVIGHSQGGGFAAHAASRNPERVRAVVGLEPTGIPAQPDPDTGMPHLQVWGDHLAEAPLWQRYRAGADRYWRQLAARGVRADTLDLPALGIAGNSHLCMLDDNSDAIADQVLAWVSRVV